MPFNVRIAVFCSLVAGCAGTEPTPQPEVAPAPAPAAPEGPKHAGLFGVVPDHMHTGAVPAQALVDLGRTLYYDPRLSKNQDVACNTCHLLDKYGVDGMPTSTGHKAQKGGRNAPTVYNAAAHVAQFWDGRAATVEDQAKGPVLNPIEMAMTDEGAVLKVLTSIPGYKTAFETAFPGDPAPISYDHMAQAIGAFERGLVTKNSRFDQYLGGKADALTPEEQAGLDLFVATGCTTCHMGWNLGGSTFQKLGQVVPYETTDEGKFAISKQEVDKFVFKTPSLRNIANTGPYFHDGSVVTLEDAIRKMGKHQLGKDLTDAEVASIAAFLQTLTGELPEAYIAKPTLPESGPDTPKPDPS